MAVLALTLFLFFLLTAFVLRSYLHYRRTGSTGFRGVSGTIGSAEWWGGVLFALALVLGLASPVSQLAGAVRPVAALDTTIWHVCGVLLAAVGIVGTLAAQQRMGASWRIGVDAQETTRLVTSGTFAVVRNPIFTTLITACVGLAMLTPNLLALLGLGALIAAIEVQVRVVEEPYLLRTHGQAYRDYSSRVGRFLPYLGRLPAIMPAGPSPGQR